MQSFIDFIKNHKTGSVISAIAALFVLISLLIWFLVPVGTSNSVEPIDIFEKSIDDMITLNMTDYNTWFRVNLIMQTALIIATLLATVFAAVTTRENAPQIKNYSIFLTAITSALTIGFSTFHIKENMDSFVKINGELVKLQYEYLRQRAPYFVELSNIHANKEKRIPEQLIPIQQSLVPRYVNMVSARMRAWANIGQQALPAMQIGINEDAPPKKIETDPKPEAKP